MELHRTGSLCKTEFLSLYPFLWGISDLSSVFVSRHRWDINHYLEIYSMVSFHLVIGTYHTLSMLVRNLISEQNVLKNTPFVNCMEHQISIVSQSRQMSARRDRKLGSHLEIASIDSRAIFCSEWPIWILRWPTICQSHRSEGLSPSSKVLPMRGMLCGFWVKQVGAGWKRKWRDIGKIESVIAVSWRLLPEAFHGLLSYGHSRMHQLHSTKANNYCNSVKLLRENRRSIQQGAMQNTNTIYFLFVESYTVHEKWSILW